MKLTVTDNFNNKAWSGWILLLFYVPLIALVATLVPNDYFVVAGFLAICFANIIAASLIGRSYVIFLIVATALILPYFWFSSFHGSTLGTMLLIVLAGVATFAISYIVVTLYKRALFFFNRPYFYLNPKKLSTKAIILRAILWLVLQLVCYSAVLIPLLSKWQTIYWIGDFWPAKFAMYIVIFVFAILLSAIIIGYQRVLSIIVLPIFSHIIFNLLYSEKVLNDIAIISVVPVFIVMGYYGNTNKISFEKVTRFLVRNCGKTKEI